MGSILKCAGNYYACVGSIFACDGNYRISRAHVMGSYLHVWEVICMCGKCFRMCWAELLHVWEVFLHVMGSKNRASACDGN